MQLWRPHHVAECTHYKATMMLNKTNEFYLQKNKQSKQHNDKETGGTIGHKDYFDGTTK